MATTDQYLLSIGHMLKDHLVDELEKFYRRKVNHFDIHSIQSQERFGATGSLIIAKYSISTDIGDFDRHLAIKFNPSKESALEELKNAILLENQFFSFPQFGVPKVLFMSTSDPNVLIYEGIEGINYDEIEEKGKLPYLAGQLLALIHGGEIRPVQEELYRDLARILGRKLATTGKELEISQAMGGAFNTIQQASSGCNAFSDFHQSNVMVTFSDGKPIKMWVIDPEFMQEGSFDRMEDVGTFFGFQFLKEYQIAGTYEQAKIDLLQFLRGYDSIFYQLSGRRLFEIYPHGFPIQFFIAFWVLMDGLDLAENRLNDPTFSHPEIQDRIDFALKFLRDQSFINFINKEMTKKLG
ncbi:MAG: hypothetical protein D6732_28240 [Methanobacteriota archaeon]|nr:MAG: hypothetical protein D6732_28240 [Euryarchaeota archaeon]